MVGVLQVAPVVADQSLVIATGGVALVAVRRGMVEAQPDEAAPQEGPPGDLGRIGFVEQRLVLLGMPAPARLGATRRVFLLDDAGARAELAQADGLFRHAGVQLVGPGADVLELAVVPAPVAVVGRQVGLQRHRMVIRRAAVGIGGQPRGILLLGQRMQVGQQGADGLVAAVDLVAHAPDGDRGVMAVLADQLPQLGLDVVAERGGLRHRGVQRDLGPHHQAELVGPLVGVGGVLVVDQAQAGEAHVHQEAQVLVDLRGAHRHAAAGAAGVEVVDAMQRVGLAVEQETALRVDAELAQAHRQLHRVDHAAGVHQLGAEAVEIRIRDPLPQVRLPHVERRRRRERRAGREPQRLRPLRHGPPRGITQRQSQLALGRLVAVVAQLHLQLEARPLGAQLLDVHAHPGAAVVQQLDVGLRGLDEAHRPDQSAEDGEVARQRRHVRQLAVVDAHGDHVGPRPQQRRDVEAEARIAALVATGVAAVDPHVGGQGRGVELQEATRRAAGRDVQAAAVPGGAAVGTAAGLAVGHVVGVRQGDGGPGGIVEVRRLGARHVGALEAPGALQRGGHAGSLRVQGKQAERQGKQGAKHREWARKLGSAPPRTRRGKLMRRPN